MARLGWIGLGDIGGQMALRLLGAGHDLIVWGRNEARLAPAVARGARAVGSAAEVASGSEAVFLCVTDTAAVEHVVFGPRGVAEGGVRGGLVVDHSTIDPARTRVMADRLMRERGMSWLDAPVSGGAAGARAGTLSIFAGGEAAALERAAAWLAAYGERITHLGASGAGQLAKSCNQAIFATTIAAWSEVIPYARAVGLDPLKLVAALEGSWSDSPVRKHIAPHLVRARGEGNSALLEKDLAIVAETAAAHGVSLPIAALAAATLKKP